MKIKIRLGTSDNATCNLVECNGELVDKTPSPKKELKKTVNSKENLKNDETTTAKKSRPGRPRAVKITEDDSSKSEGSLESGKKFSSSFLSTHNKTLFSCREWQRLTNTKHQQ